MLQREFRSDTLIGNFGTLGGFFGVMYGLIQLVIGGFEEFAYESSLRRRLYTQNKKPPRSDQVYEKDEYEQEVADTILNRRQLEYYYWEHLLTSCMLFCCWCSSVQSKDWYKRHKLRNELFEEANDRLEGETDILHFIRTSRILNFITLYSLRRNQRQLVQYFKAYHLDEDELELPPEKPPQSTEEMLRRFDPRTNLDDHRILYEITGHKLEQAQFDIHYEDEGRDGDSRSDREDSDLDGQIVKSVYRRAQPS